MKTRVFKTVDELTEFIKEFEENWADNILYLDKIVDVNYFKLTASLRLRKKNRSFDQESNEYLYAEICGRDSLSLMKWAEKLQHPSDTKWMLSRSKTMIKERNIK